LHFGGDVVYFRQLGLKGSIMAEIPLIHAWELRRVEFEAILNRIAKESVVADTETIEALRDIDAAKEVLDPKAQRMRPPTLEEMGYDKKAVRRLETEGWVERFGGGHNSTLKGKIELGSSRGKYQWPHKSHEELVHSAVESGQLVRRDVLEDYAYTDWSKEALTKLEKEGQIFLDS